MGPAPGAGGPGPVFEEEPGQFDERIGPPAGGTARRLALDVVGTGLAQGQGQQLAPSGSKLADSSPRPSRVFDRCRERGGAAGSGRSTSASARARHRAMARAVSATDNPASAGTTSDSCWEKRGAVSSPRLASIACT